MLERIVSGGQTGADIAALELALERSIPLGGWCPRGRRSLAGPIPDCFPLRETPSSAYLQRTEWNVRDSDGTVILTLGESLSGGSLKTDEFARLHRRPALHLSRARQDAKAAAAALQAFLDEHLIRTLNVAGPREEKEPGIHAWTREVLRAALWPVAGPEATGQALS